MKICEKCGGLIDYEEPIAGTPCYCQTNYCLTNDNHGGSDMIKNPHPTPAWPPAVPPMAGWPEVAAPEGEEWKGQP